MRKQNYFLITCILILALPLLAACNGTPAEEPTATVDTESVIATSIAQTMQAMAETQTAEVTPTPLSTATPDTLPTATVAAGLPTATLPSVSLPANCLLAGLVSETIPDGSVIARGASFTKTWSIRNGGTCTWSTSYKMVFESGELLGATSETVNLTQNVSPGMMTAVSIKMTAPNTDGTYIGYWNLLTDAGVLVGRFSVNIYVGTPTVAPFAVTSVTYYKANTVLNVTCGTTATTSIPIYITTDGPGNVTYYITSNYGAAAAGDLTFTSAEKKTIYYSMTFPTGTDEYDVDINVMINNPNNQLFQLRNVDAKCP